MSKGETTKQAILHRATQLASVHGLDGISIGGLADAMSMSKSGVFAHFGSREDLQIAVRPLVLPDIEERFWAIDGSVYHVDPTIARFGPNKPVTGFAGYRTPVEGLFLTGSGTHPVAGISGMPGQNAARTMLKQFHLEDRGGRLGILKDRLWRDRRRAAALTTDPYTSGPNDPFPGQE